MRIHDADHYTHLPRRYGAAKQGDVKRPAISPQFAASVRLQVAMDEAQLLAMGARIKELKQRSGLKQKHIAKALGVGLRRYQAIQQHGTTEYDKVEILAKLFKTDPDWIWDGKERQPTPKLTGPKLETRLTRIEEKLDQVLDALDADAAVRDVDDVVPQTPQADPLPALEPASNATKAATGKRRAARR